MAQAALAADFYRRPLFEYVLHLKAVREAFGDEAARLEVEHALALRELRIKKANEPK